MNRPFAIGFMLAAVLGAAMFAGACGGDDNGSGDGDAENAMPLEEYFSELAAISQELSVSNGEAFSTLGTSDDLGELKSAFGALPEALQTFLDDIGDLAPPSDAADAHASAERDGQAFLTRLEEVNDDVQAARDVDAFIATAGNDDLQALDQALGERCRELQEIANENDIEADLACPS